MLLKKLKIAAANADHRRRMREEERDKKREEEREKKRAFLENGGLVLEKLVACCNGRPIPIRTFSYQQLILATNDFDQRLILLQDGWYTLYKGSFEGRILSIKMFRSQSSLVKDRALMDIGISAKASAHKNILKLVGCCLETSIPSLVFEYAQNGVLADQIYISKRQGTPMLWQSRLQIARQTAHAIAYLHTGFSKPIIHRDIKLKNILLDQRDVPKLSNFSLSISIPEGETHVVAGHMGGTFGFLCPSYIHTCMVTEKTDVYSFGMVLLGLLTGRHPFDYAQGYEDEYLGEESEDEYLGENEYQPLKVHLSNRAMNEIVDPAILAEEGGAGLEQQLQAVRQLVLTCIEVDPEIRPTIVDVTKELRRIERFIA